MSRFVIGDIHGSVKALNQCLTRSGFDIHSDVLISLGDLCDGWPETAAVYEELLKIKRLIFVRGNHDQMMLDWVRQGIYHPAWLANGGQATIDSYPDDVPDSHSALLDSSLPFYLENDQLFIHAGFHTDKPFEEQDMSVFLWDRSLFKKAINAYFNGSKTRLTQFKEVYIGHCPIHRYDLTRPAEAGGIWMMDTGAGWEGKLSMMNLDTGAVYQSDTVSDFYPPGSGRGG